MMIGCSQDDEDGSLFSDSATAQANNGIDTEIVEMVTSMGTLVIELDATNAPVTVENFLRYVNSGFYDGDDKQGATIFHRVIENFVAQGGGFNTNGTEKFTNAPIAIESNNGLSNLRGTIAMARTNEPDSATSQFYFNLIDNFDLNYVDDNNPGYTVFGQVIEGMEVLDTIGGIPPGASGRPIQDIIINDCEQR